MTFWVLPFAWTGAVTSQSSPFFSRTTLVFLALSSLSTVDSSILVILSLSSLGTETLGRSAEAAVTECLATCSFLFWLVR